MENLSPHQYKLLQAARFLRTMPVDYTSADLNPNFDQREFRHDLSREFIRTIASGEAAEWEYNERIAIEREFKRAKAHGYFRAANDSSKQSDSKTADGTDGSS